MGVVAMENKVPTRSGLWWITLDDGYQYVTEPVLVKVIVHRDRYPDEEGAELAWLDDSGRSLSLRKMDQRIAEVSRVASIGGFVTGCTSEGEHRVTWLCEAHAPKKVPAKGEALPVELRA
jgi:hypothetical protein